jgi:hypothetical protein
MEILENQPEVGVFSAQCFAFVFGERWQRVENSTIDWWVWRERSGNRYVRRADH